MNFTNLFQDVYLDAKMCGWKVNIFWKDKQIHTELLPWMVKTIIHLTIFSEVQTVFYLGHSRIYLVNALFNFV